MTINCAARCLKKDGTYITVVGSDKEVTVIDERVLGLVDDHKFYRIKDAVVSICGNAVGAEVCEIIQGDPLCLEELDFSNKDGIRYFAEMFFGTLKEYAMKGMNEDSADQVGSIMITLPGRLYVVFNDMCIFQYDKYTTSGSGATIADAVLYTLYKRLPEDPEWEDLEAMVREAIETASTFVLGCGSGLVIERVVDEHIEERSKRARTKTTKQRRN